MYIHHVHHSGQQYKAELYENKMLHFYELTYIHLNLVYISATHEMNRLGPIQY